MTQFTHYGNGVKIWPMARLVGPIWIGDHAMVDDFALIITKTGVRLEDYSHVCAFASILGGDSFTLGEFSGVGVGVRVFTSTENYETMVSATIPWPYRAPHMAPVVIGRHVTIGANSVILPGVTIGDGAVIGALSLAKEDLEPWTIYAGIPCRPIKKRDKDAVLEWEAKFRG